MKRLFLTWGLWFCSPPWDVLAEPAGMGAAMGAAGEQSY